EVEDGVGFPEVAAVLQLQYRNLAVGVLLKEFRRARLALEDVHLDPLIGDLAQHQDQLNLVAVAGTPVAVELVHSVLPRNVATPLLSLVSGPTTTDHFRQPANAFIKPLRRDMAEVQTKIARMSVRVCEKRL